MTSGVGDPCRQALCTASHQANVGRCRLSKGPLAAAGTQQCGGRLPPPGVAAASSQLTCTPSTVHRATWQLPSYKTGHRRRRQQTSNLFLSAGPGLSRQTYFGKDIEMKGVGLSQRGLQRSLFTNLRKVLQLYNICFNCPCYEDQGISELTL